MSDEYVKPPEPQIEVTKDYTLFKFSKMQRELDPLHVQKITKSMKRRGFIRSSHIIVSADMEIIDGQHRFQAAKNLGLPVYYVVETELEVEDVRDMALTHHAWKTEDYVTSFIRQGREDYRRMHQVKERSGLNWDAFMRIVSTNSPQMSKDVRFGKIFFSAEMETRVEEFLEKFDLFKQAFPKGWFHHHFVVACVFVFTNPKYDHAQMEKRLAYQSTRMVRCANAKDYVDLLQSIYNYNSRAENIVSFEKRRMA